MLVNVFMPRLVLGRILFIQKDMRRLMLDLHCVRMRVKFVAEAVILMSLRESPLILLLVNWEVVYFLKINADFRQIFLLQVKLFSRFWKYYFQILLMFVLFVGEPHSDASGKTYFAEFPWMVAILLRYPGKNDAFVCGGSMINSKVVLTAGHCMEK